MANRIIANKRSNDTNIQKNRIRVQEEQEFNLPSDVVRTVQDRDALIAALEVFIEVTSAGLKLPRRAHDRDVELIGYAQRVLGRLV